jgi:hypothetical protein
MPDCFVFGRALEINLEKSHQSGPFPSPPAHTLMVHVVVLIIEKSNPIHSLLVGHGHYDLLPTFLLVTSSAIDASGFDAVVTRLIGHVVHLVFDLLAVVLDLLSFEGLFELFEVVDVEEGLRGGRELALPGSLVEPLLLSSLLLDCASARLLHGQHLLVQSLQLLIIIFLDLNGICLPFCALRSHLQLFIIDVLQRHIHRKIRWLKTFHG